METDAEYLIFSNLWDRMVFNTLGLLLAIYALYVEVKVESDPSYKPMCDIDPNRISCTKVLTSPYGRGFGLLPPNNTLNVRNCTLGILFYTLQIVLGFSSNQWIQAFVLYTSVISILGTLYLAFILLFVLKNLCLVCFATYFVNAAVLYLNYYRKSTY